MGYRQEDSELGAQTNNNLGYCYSQIASEVQGEAQQNLYDQAVNCYRQALIVYQPKILPLDCVRTGRNFGNLGFKIGNWEWGVDGYEWAMKVDVIQLAEIQQLIQDDVTAIVSFYSTNDRTFAFVLRRLTPP